jgi:hypothetical protein
MRQIEFTISPGVQKDVEIAELERHLQHLTFLFKERTNDVVPAELAHPPQAHHAIRLSKKLSAVEHCGGFSEHLKLYRDGVGAAFFVTCLAELLVARGGVVEFEPSTSGGHKADLAVALGKDEMIIECKAPIETAQFDTLEEHQRMFSMLSQYLEEPYHVAIHYRETLTEEDLRRLGESIQKRLPHVTEDGVIFASAEIEVSVDRTVSQALPKGFQLIVGMVGPEPSDNAILPGHGIIRDGRNMAFYGPVIDFSRILQERLRKARRQAPKNKPYVVAIASSMILGAPRVNIAALRGEFQPKKNRRISGALMADFLVYVDEREEAKLDYVHNPFAFCPVPKELMKLLA